MIIRNCYINQIIVITLLLLFLHWASPVLCWNSDGVLKSHESDRSIQRDSMFGIGEMDRLDTQMGDEIYKRSLLGEVTRMTASLLAVLGLIVACVFALKKLTRHKSFVTGNISIISSMPLGQKKSICLVRVSNEILIIGLTNSDMSLLTKMSLEDYYGEGAGNRPLTQNIYQHETNSQGFRKLLSKLSQLKMGFTLDRKRW